jgi:hypothetical protein
VYQTREDQIILEAYRLLRERHALRNRVTPYVGRSWRFAVAKRYLRRFYRTPAAYEKVMATGFVEGFLSVQRAAEMSLEVSSKRCVTCGKAGLLFRSFVNRNENDTAEFVECAHCGAIERTR